MIDDESCVVLSFSSDLLRLSARLLQELKREADAAKNISKVASVKHRDLVIICWDCG